MLDLTDCEEYRRRSVIMASALLKPPSCLNPIFREYAHAKFDSVAQLRTEGGC